MRVDRVNTAEPQDPACGEAVLVRYDPLARGDPLEGAGVMAACLAGTSREA